jgi:repressor LexA
MFTEQGNKNRVRVYEFIRSFAEKNGYPPSVREIGRGVGLASTKAVKYHMDALVSDGLLRRHPRLARAIDAGPQPVGLPLVGRIAAGQPVLAVENIEEHVSLNRFRGCFLLRVKGDSMTGAGILDGDTVIVQPQGTVPDGEIAVAMVDNEATVKRLYRRAGQIVLQPENPLYSPLEINPDARDFRVVGRVVGVLREYVRRA